MFPFPPRTSWLIFAGTIGIFLIVIVGGTVEFFNPRLTRYVDSDAFREALEKETGKGLHFLHAQYSPIQRTGFLTARSESFRANDGEKALKSLEARDITAKFNPWGVFLRRWQFDELSIHSSEAEIQIYKHEPEAAPSKPWFSILLPNRV